MWKKKRKRETERHRKERITRIMTVKRMYEKERKEGRGEIGLGVDGEKKGLWEREGDR